MCLNVTVTVCKCANVQGLIGGLVAMGGLGGGFIYQGVLYNVTEAVEADDDSCNQHELVVGPSKQKTENRNRKRAHIIQHAYSYFWTISFSRAQLGTL